MKWYRKNWRPWGYTIGHHDVAYYSGYEIHKHFTEKGRVKHYCIMGYTKDGRVVPFKTLKSVISFIEKDLPCT